jgi:hypothetical protein
MKGYTPGKILLPTSIGKKRKMVTIWRLHLSNMQLHPDLLGKTAATSDSSCIEYVLSHHAQKREVTSDNQR